MTTLADRINAASPGDVIVVEYSDPAREDRTAKLKVREGLRLVLTGLEELWKLPRSVETKKEQGRR